MIRRGKTKLLYWGVATETLLILRKPLLTQQVSVRFSRDQRFLRFIDLDAKYLTEVPFFFKPLEPAMQSIKDGILLANSYVNFPWWAVLFCSALLVRVVIFPLVLTQMKRISRVGPVAPAFVHIKDTWKDSQLPLRKRLLTVWRFYREVAKREGFRVTTLWVYNLAYFPFLIAMVYSVRKLLGSPQLADASFLYISNFSEIDPFFILPTITVGLYYWNFERFITAQNRYTLISRIRVACQILLILWYPFLCCWPSGIVIYMCSNALISVLQTTLMKSPWFLSKISQKVTFYGYILSRVEFDKGTAESVVKAIRSGDEVTSDKAIKEDELMRQTEGMLAKLELDQKEQEWSKQQTQEQQLSKRSQISRQPQKRIGKNDLR